MDDTSGDNSLELADPKAEDSVKESLWHDRKIMAYVSLGWAIMISPFYATLGFYMPQASYSTFIELGIWSLLGSISLVGAYMGLKSYFSKGS